MLVSHHESLVSLSGCFADDVDRILRNHLCVQESLGIIVLTTTVSSWKLGFSLGCFGNFYVQQNIDSIFVHRGDTTNAY